MQIKFIIIILCLFVYLSFFVQSHGTKYIRFPDYVSIVLSNTVNSSPASLFIVPDSSELKKNKSIHFNSWIALFSFPFLTCWMKKQVSPSLSQRMTHQQICLILSYHSANLIPVVYYTQDHVEYLHPA